MTAVARIVYVSPLHWLLVLGALVMIGGMIALFVWTMAGDKHRK